MKIIVSQNRTAIDQIRKSINVKEDLAKFDQFIAKYQTIDLTNSQQQEDAACCGGENCCQHITVSVPISAV